MSDLLGRLISRAKGAPSTVEPILPSRYETPVAFEPQSAAPEMRVSAIGEDPGRRQALSNETPRRVDAPREEHRVRRAEQDLDSDERSEAVKRDASGVPAGLDRSRSKVETKAEPFEQRPADLPIEGRGNIRIGMEQTETRADRIPVPSSEERPTPIEELSVTVNRSHERSAPLSSASISNARREESARPAEAQPIEVHVTIGHIEVRAAAPATALPQRIARPRVGLSLEEYLKRRNGGSR